MVCKSQGAKVVIAGLTKDEKRFEVARTLGFDRIVDQMKEDLGTVMNEMTDGIVTKTKSMNVPALFRH